MREHVKMPQSCSWQNIDCFVGRPKDRFESPMHAENWDCNCFILLISLSISLDHHCSVLILWGLMNPHIITMGSVKYLGLYVKVSRMCVHLFTGQFLKKRYKSWHRENNGITGNQCLGFAQKSSHFSMPSSGYFCPILNRKILEIPIASGFLWFCDFGLNKT